jgi:drug/metabolite transporter (DMT)-like permease
VSDEDESSRSRRGLLWGGVGLLVFSVTLPATRAAVPELGAVPVGLGRGLVAALLAGLLLLALRDRVPARRHWPGLAVVALGVAVGFPLLSALALRSVPSSHGSVVIGLMPAATAVMAVFRAGERPRPLFWLGCAGGTLAVLLFAAAEGSGRPQATDLLLLGAVLLGGLGYAEGGRLAREIGAWRVICWALVFAAPVLAVPVLQSLPRNVGAVSGAAWLGFVWVSVGSAFLGFFAWYRGLALGGVARVGQLQLLQPALALGWSALLLGEPVTPREVTCSLLVVAAVATCIRTGRTGRCPAAAPAPTVAESQEPPALAAATCGD